VKLIVQPDAGLVPVVQAIRRARRTIDICIFRFDRTELEKALATAVVRGVRVRALIAHTNRGGDRRLRLLEQRLLGDGISVTRTADHLLRYHGKFLIADEVLYLFGFNFTRLDIEKSRSFAIATRDRRTLLEATRLFDADLARQTYIPARSNLVVSPETSREMLATFLRGAKKELAIYDAKVQDPAMIRILEQRAADNVRVRVIGSVKGPHGGIDVSPLASMRLHVRAIIRDGTRAFVGSQSLRTVELEQRREVGLLISNPSVTRALMQVFEADWAASSPSKAKKKEKKKNT
jgi:cardiolipin synthase A/B